MHAVTGRRMKINSTKQLTVMAVTKFTAAKGILFHASLPYHKARKKPTKPKKDDDRRKVFSVPEHFSIMINPNNTSILRRTYPTYQRNPSRETSDSQ